MSYRVAIDLGAGSGRSFLGRFESGELHLEEVHRFHYTPSRRQGHERWDMRRIIKGVEEGIRKAHLSAGARGGSLSSVGVDSWGVDYGLLDARGRLIEDPITYRDGRTQDVMEEVTALIPREEIFARTGIQSLQLNTIYQLFAHVREGLPREAARLLMIPDLCHHHLCGSDLGERTNASTTQLLRVETGTWDDDLFARLELPRSLMPDLVPAGSILAPLLKERRAELGTGEILVLAPATHDTASAVAGTPLEPGWAFLSSGTWSLLGLERQTPVLGEAAARANLTNEAGACGTVRLLKNVMGLWILESCRREWDARGCPQDMATLLDRLRAIDQPPGVVFPDDPRFFNPESMVETLRAALEETGQPAPDDPAPLARIILDSLALRYASVLDTLEAMTGSPILGLHVVGGGSRNDYLNQATADATGRPVRAGLPEATAAGNLLLQGLASGELASLSEGRRLLEGPGVSRQFYPRSSHALVNIKGRYKDIEAQSAG